MKRSVLPIAGVIAFALGLIAFAPLRVALAWAGAGEAGLSANKVEGSIWSGVLKGATLRGFPLGDLKASVDPLSLVGGTVRLSLVGKLGSATLVKGQSQGLEDVNLTAGLEQLGLSQPAPGR